MIDAAPMPPSESRPASLAPPFRLELVSHVWRYSRLFLRQASALILHPPPLAFAIGRPPIVELTYTVFFCPTEDAATAAAVAWLADQSWPRGLRFNPWPLSRGELCRRAIGRNLACKATAADWLWLADVDYLPGPGSLAAMAAALPKIPGPLGYFRHVNVSRDHAAGDRAIAEVDGLRVYPLPPAEDFESTRNRRAVGGFQLYRGETARERGYLPGHRKWQKPEPEWRRTFEDRVFRGWLGTNGVPIDVGGIFRIRHSKRGRTDIGVEL